MATQKQIDDFINLIAPSVVYTCSLKGWGVPSAIIAQAGLESAWGTSGLWKTCFNGWGMKWKEGCRTDYKEYKTKEQRADGSYYEIVARFRKYPDVLSGIKGYFNFIESYPRYKPLFTCKTYTEYANTIRACGWATSLNYANNIINTVNKYNLTRFDKGPVVPISSTSRVPYIIGNTYTTESDLYIRDKANGNKIKFECITLDAKAHSKFDDLGYAILKAGTRVTCKNFVVLDNSTWVQIPSGWICAKNKSKIYVK